jgi:hypothetical protein
MPISRRRFLGYAVGVSAAGLAGASQWTHTLSKNPNALSGCALIDSGPFCPLRESPAGYESALLAAHAPYVRTSYQPLQQARTIILPAAAFMDESKLARVRAHLENGSAVLFESGAAFLNPEEFKLHRHLMKSVFGLQLHDPVRLWDSAESFKQSPYLDFHWPIVTKVRDFSRVIPVECERGETIAWFQKMPVAVKRRIGKGTFVFLGSPLGPHLLAGDREAAGWLSAFRSS